MSVRASGGVRRWGSGLAGVPPEQVAALKEALGSLALEKAVQKLLERNQRALVRLGELQRLRMAAHPAGGAPEEGSEEWDTGV